MKVAAVFMAMPVGGAEDLAAGLARDLAGRGVETKFVCLRERGAVGEELESAGADFTLLRCSKGRRFSWPGVLALAKWLRENGIDIVHSHTYHSHTYAVPAARSAGCAVVLHHHKTLEKMKWHRRWTLSLMFRKADAVIALSRQTAGDIERAFKLPPGKARAIPNAVDAGLFSPVSAEEKLRLRERLGLPLDAFLLGSAASLQPVKNHPATLDAAALCARAHPDKKLSVLIFGEGPERPALEAKIRALSLGGNAALLGPRRPVAPWLAALDAFSLPSFWEGQSLALLQALACGLPVLASRIEGNTAVLGEKHPGLFDPSDIPRYASLISQLLGDPGFSRRLLEAQASLPLPSWGDLLDRTEAVYREALAAKSRSR